MAEHGVALEIPELDGGEFERLTLSRQLDVVARVTGGRPAVLMGSSLGGYLAALYAERRLEVERLVLLAPAFDFYRRWATRLGPEELNRWREERTMRVFHYGQMRERALGFELYSDAARYPAYPDVTQPALVLQGLQDDIVPPEVAAEFCAVRPNAILRLFPAGHELTGVLPELWAATAPFLFK